MVKANFVVFDCETGGLFEKENPITQFACVILDYSTLKEIDRFETYVKPYNDLVVTQKALDSTMVTMSDIKKKGVDVEDFVEALDKFLKNHNTSKKKPEKGKLVPVGQNIPFDIRFLTYAFKLCKKSWKECVQDNFIDTYPLAKLSWGIKGDEKLNLGANCERAKISLTDAHGAMNDVEATAELLRFFAKKLRSKKGDSSETSTRKSGVEFFEFKCIK